MLDGWYCRTMANEQAATEQNDHNGSGNDLENDNEQDTTIGDSVSDEDSHDNEAVSDTILRKYANPNVDYKSQYYSLKKKLKFLLYENEFFQDALRSSQRRLLKITRDKSFLLDRLLQYEKHEASSSESDETESSDDNDSVKIESVKKRKSESGILQVASRSHIIKRKRPAPKKPAPVPTSTSSSQNSTSSQSIMSDGHMTAEEVERHLQSRQSLMELVPERAPPTVPNEMFSNEPSLDGESNDQMIETSPSNIDDDCISTDMTVITD